MTKVQLYPGEAQAIIAIAKRAARMAAEMGATVDDLEIAGDVAQVHRHCQPLALGPLLAASDLDFAHDVFGIREHIDRESGRLRASFAPRFASIIPRKESANG